MLTHKVITNTNSVGSAVAYYVDSRDDYYLENIDSTKWLGKGAEELGLSGTVDRDDFGNLLLGKFEDQQLHKSSREDQVKRLAVDLTFSAPKSVSIQALVGKDIQMIEAHEKALERALKEVENFAYARKTVNGKTVLEKTDNLVIATHRHETNRESDPQLHTHAIVMNATKRADGSWRALKNDEIIKNTKYLGMIYRNELAKELTMRGYELRQEKGGFFELANISRKQIEGFSNRNAQIEKYLESQNLTRETASAGKKQIANLATRKSKDHSLSRDDIAKVWDKTAKDLKIEFSNSVETKSAFQKNDPLIKEQKELSNELIAQRAVNYSINHLNERSSVLSHKEVLEHAINFNLGSATEESINKEIVNQLNSKKLIAQEPLYKVIDARNETAMTKSQWIDKLIKDHAYSESKANKAFNTSLDKGRFQKLPTKYVTQRTMKSELNILKMEEQGRQKANPIMSKITLQQKLATKSLNSTQKKSVETILTTTNQYIGIQGKAGTGKSYMLQTAIPMLEENGYKIKALAPYASQVKNLQSDGIEAKTLASFLHAKEKDIDNKTVIVLDEAGLVPTRQYEQLMKIAEEHGARIVSLGDTQQTRAVEAGKPFYQLQHNGMQTVVMDEILRQKNQELKTAVEAIVKGDAKLSLDNVSVTCIKNNTERERQVADTYTSLSAEDRKQTIVVTGTNVARDSINEMIRGNLNMESNQNASFDTLKRSDTTQEQRQYSNNYSIGQAIQVEVDYPKLGLYESNTYEVINAGVDKTITVRDYFNKEAEPIVFDPMNKNISVYDIKEKNIAIGEEIKITRNDASLDIANGDRFTVTGIKDQSITISNQDKTIELDQSKILHTDYSYVSTVHSSQGLTSDRVIIDMPAEIATTSKETYYVAISRAKHEAMIFTEAPNKLTESISKSSLSASATELSQFKDLSRAEIQHIISNDSPKYTMEDINNKYAPKENLTVAIQDIIAKENSLAPKDTLTVEMPTQPQMNKESVMSNEYDDYAKMMDQMQPQQQHQSNQSDFQSYVDMVQQQQPQSMDKQANPYEVNAQSLGESTKNFAEDVQSIQQNVQKEVAHAVGMDKSPSIEKEGKADQSYDSKAPGSNDSKDDKEKKEKEKELQKDGFVASNVNNARSFINGGSGGVDIASLSEVFHREPKEKEAGDSVQEKQHQMADKQKGFGE